MGQSYSVMDAIDPTVHDNMVLFLQFSVSLDLPPVEYTFDSKSVDLHQSKVVFGL
jgi:hypothetical protein